jgi:hypothetical protein
MTGGEPKTLQLLRDLFGGKSTERREDIAAWLLDADEAGLARLTAMPPPKKKTLWRTLGLYLDLPDEESCERCLRLIQTAKSEDDLLFWIVRHGGGRWIATFHRWLNRKRGGRNVPFETHESTYEQTTETRALLLEDLRGDETLFGGCSRRRRGPGATGPHGIQGSPQPQPRNVDPRPSGGHDDASRVRTCPRQTYWCPILHPTP